MPDDPDDLGLPLNANGPAYTSSEARHGVPLDCVAEKLGTAIEDLHRYGRQHPPARELQLAAAVRAVRQVDLKPKLQRRLTCTQVTSQLKTHLSSRVAKASAISGGWPTVVAA